MDVSLHGGQFRVRLSNAITYVPQYYCNVVTTIFWIAQYHYYFNVSFPKGRIDNNKICKETLKSILINLKTSLRNLFTVSVFIIFCSVFVQLQVFTSETQIYTKNTNYKFKLIKICLRVTCRKHKNVLSPCTFKHEHKCSCKKQRKENVIHDFTVGPLTQNVHKQVLPTQTKTGSKSCRFISLWKNP